MPFFINQRSDIIQSKLSKIKTGKGKSEFVKSLNYRTYLCICKYFQGLVHKNKQICSQSSNICQCKTSGFWDKLHQMLNVIQGNHPDDGSSKHL
jgi:hypothetical protein